MHIKPYLYFNGRTEEALEFYRATLGAEIDLLMRFKENPNPEQNPPGSDEKIMHSTFRIGATVMMASDGQCGGESKFDGISLALAVPTAAEAERLFALLADGGQIQMPMTKTFFSERFGMVGDRFGVSWLFTVAPE